MKVISPQDLFKYKHSFKIYDSLIKNTPPSSHKVWKWFVAINEIPHSSSKIIPISQYFQKIGHKLGGIVKSDCLNNVSIKFEGKGSKKLNKSIILQGHMDMVCTKTENRIIDFEKDPIKMMIVDNRDKGINEKEENEKGYWLTADGTTLGADDGIGLAAAFSIIEETDETLKDRPPIEILITVDEEIGLIGAMGLKEGELLSENAKYLINLDFETIGETCIGCAGGIMRKVHIPIERELISKDFDIYSIKIDSFKGGHSGMQVDCRESAIKWMMKMLEFEKDLKIIKFDGGNAHNAIPTFCETIIAIPNSSSLKFVENVEKIFKLCKKKTEKIETNPPKLSIIKIDNNKHKKCLKNYHSLSILQLINSFHHGVFTWDSNINNLIETSQSLSVINLFDNKIVAQIYARSSNNNHLKYMSDIIDKMAKLYNGEAEIVGTDMAGWPADKNSFLLKKAKSIHQDLFKKEIKDGCIHAALECGIIISKYPKNKIEAISIGPTIKNVHSVDEKLEINSTCQFYSYLLKIVQNL